MDAGAETLSGKDRYKSGVIEYRKMGRVQHEAI
jgi:hypothetical protein